MMPSDWIAAIGAVFTGGSMVAAIFTFLWTWKQYLRDQRQQRAAQTREVLQAIIGDCSRFLRPLSEQYPYPILHTATAITKEFCSRMGENPRGKDVQMLLRNKELLLSICVEGWINSTQIFRMLGIAEDLEHKAASHYLRGKLLLICNASFFLAGLVALVCSPESFYDMLRDLKNQSSAEDEAEDALNAITVTLQQRICKEFDDNYRKTIQQSLDFIQTAANAFISLSDERLVNFAQAEEQHKHAPLSSSTDAMSKSDQETLLREHLEWMKMLLNDLNPDGRGENSIDKNDYTCLRELIDSIEERWNTKTGITHAKQAAIA
jgi:hypothetical protein